MSWHLLAVVQAEVVTARRRLFCFEYMHSALGHSSRFFFWAIPNAGFPPLAIRAKGGQAAPPLNCLSPL